MNNKQKVLSIKYITLLVDYSVDIIYLAIDVPSNMKIPYSSSLRLETDQGLGLQCIQEMFGCEPDRIISGKQGMIKG